MVEENKTEVVEEKKEEAVVKTEEVKEEKVEEVKTEDKKDFKVEEKTETLKNKPKVEEKKEGKKSVPAVSKEKKEKKTSKTPVKKVELEREYIIPLRKEILKVPAYKRAKKAIKAMKQFLAKHMRVEDRDLRKVKIDMYLNNEVWFKGIKKPLTKVKVIAKKIDGIVYAELAEIPEVVKYTMARHEKRKLSGTKAPSKGKDRLEKEDVEDKDKDGVADKVEESEDKKSGSIKEAETQKAAAGGAHKGRTAPIRKTLR